MDWMRQLVDVIKDAIAHDGPCTIVVSSFARERLTHSALGRMAPQRTNISVRTDESVNETRLEI